MAQVQRVKVARAFRHRGDDLGVGSVLDFELPVAQELRSAKKLEFVAADTPAKIIPMPKREKNPAAVGRGDAALSAGLTQLAAHVSKLTEQVSLLTEVVDKALGANNKGGK